MRQIVLVLVLILVAGAATAQINQPIDAAPSGPGGRVEGSFVVDVFPNFDTAADLNVWRVQGLAGDILTVEATDSCLAGDMWDVAILSLPGPAILDVGTTTGAAPSCACAWGGVPDTTISAALTTGGVATRYRSGADSFPASFEMRMSASVPLTVTQLRGADACGCPC